VDVGAGDLVGVGATVDSVGTCDGEALGKGEGERTAVEWAVGRAGEDASAEGEEVTSVGK
jgi:hypothetical protein